MRCASRTTPLGAFTLAAAGGAIVRVWLPGETPRQGRDAATPLLEQAFQELEEFLAGIRRRFTIPLAPSGTPFPRSWAHGTSWLTNSRKRATPAETGCGPCPCCPSLRTISAVNSPT